MKENAVPHSIAAKCTNKAETFVIIFWLSIEVPEKYCYIITMIIGSSSQ